MMEATNRGKTPLDEELKYLEEKRGQVLEDIRSGKIGDNSGSNPVALLPVNLSKATLAAMNAVNASFPDFGKLVQIEIKTPDPENPTRYADYEVLPLDQYLVHAEDREKVFREFLPGRILCPGGKKSGRTQRCKSPSEQW